MKRYNKTNSIHLWRIEFIYRGC